MKNKVVCVVAGKSGGHIIPGMTSIHQYVQAHPEYRVLFFSTDTALDRSLIALYPFVYSYVPLRMGGVPGKKIWLYPLFLLQCLRAVGISYHYLRKQRPDRVVSMGGYLSIPVCIAAWWLRIPIELFELNAEPGKAVLWLAPLARKVFIVFDEARAYFKKTPVQLTEYPLRFTANDRMPQASALVQLGLHPALKTIVILGGSQGSRSINELMQNFFSAYPELAGRIQVIHQAGARNVDDLVSLYNHLGIKAVVYDYDHNVQYTYCAADLIIARAGAGTLFEIGFFEKRAIIVPLEVSSTMHQVANAEAMVHLDKERARILHREPLFTVFRQKAIESNPAQFYAEILKEAP